MEIIKNNKSTSAFLLSLVIVLILSIFTNVSSASASDIGSGIGGNPTNPGVGSWYYTMDTSFDKYKTYGPGATTQAWKNFVNYQIQPSVNRAKSESGMVSLIKGYVNGQGFKNPDGSYEELYLSCMKSQYIWYYGDPGDNKRFLTQAGLNTVNPPTGMPMEMAIIWDNYKTMPGTTWGQRPGPVLVCSGAFDRPETPNTITLKANSGTFVYNGSWHTVDGWTHIGGDLKKDLGHRIEARAIQSYLNVGQMPVMFSLARIVDGSGRDVSSQYIIKTIPGVIKVVPIGEETDLYRCVYSGSDSISNIITANHLRIDPVPISGTISSVVGSNGQIYIMNPTDADELMSLSNMPSVNDSRSQWNSWKSRVTAVGNQRHIDIDLNDIFKGSSSFADLFSKYGGVLDVRINHSKEKASATFCQPQTRTSWQVPVYYSDGNGNTYYSHSYTAYSEWTNSGEEIIQTVTDPSADTPERSSYQILGVNCNAEGFINARNTVSARGELEASSLIEATGSGYMRTKRKALPSNQSQDHLSSNFILGYASGISITANSAFYTDGTTCKENGLCVVTPGPNGSPNDSHNNTPAAYQPSNALFAHMSDEYASLTPSRFGFPGDKNTPALNDDEIVFFRDNEERTVRADVWRMRASNSGWITNESQAAVRTLARIFAGATPEYEITTIKLEGDDDSKKLAIGVNEFDGSENKFVFKSQWASNEGKPYKLGENWVYSIGAQRGKVNVISGTSVTTNTVTDYIEVACQFKNESSAQNATVNKNPFINPHLSNSAIPWDESRSVKVLFSRGVSDKRD